ncbi:hypothetical protein BJX99DRAFT_220568 [Aspergillus californicus]
MSSRIVIVFGPTGGVGSAVARTAHSHGANVVLAMRNTSKHIPGLSATEEQNGRYERVQADLNDADSVQAAVSKTGASYAFIYSVLGASPDHMRSTAKALKAANIKSVVLLSSFGTQGDIRAIQPSDFIAHEHAQVEISLEDTFGPQGYVAVRPAFFASNSLWWQKQIIEDGEVKWAFPDLKLDFISPDDIGAVCGTILAGAVDGEQENPISLLGPEQDFTIANAIGVIGQVIKKPVKVTKIGLDENVQVMMSKSGLPEPVAKTLTEGFAGATENHGLPTTWKTPDVRANIEKYLKRPAMRFSEWVELNKDKFTT